MASCRQSTASAEHFVNWAHVDATCRSHSILLWHEPNDWHFSVQLFRVRVVDHMCRIVPPGSFHKHTIEIATVLRFLGDLSNRVLINYLEVELQLVNSNNVLTSVVLQRRC